MKLLLLLLLLPSCAFADVRTDTPGLVIQDVDGTNAGRYRVLKVTNGTSTNNADGSVTVTTGSGGGGTPAGGLNAVQYNSPVGTFAGSETKFSFNGTNVGINTTDAKHASLGIVITGSTSPFAISSDDTLSGNRFVMLSGGNVGIATVNPVTKFQVNAGVAQFSVNVNGNVGVGTTATTTGMALFTNSGSTYLRTRSNDSTGESGYFSRNDVADGFTFSTYSSASTGGFGAGTGRLDWFSGNGKGLWMGSQSAVPVTWYTSNLERVTIDSGGNVGIGTIMTGATGRLIVSGGNVGVGSLSPGTVLDVQGTTRTTGLQLNLAPLAGGNVMVSDAVGTGTWMPASTLNIVATASAAGGINAVQYNNPIGSMAGTENVFSMNGTNVGIGTTNGTTLLDVRNGNVGIGSTNVTKHALLEVTGNSTLELIRAQSSTNETTPFVVGSNSNVGIGTTNTSFFQLEVVGDINATNGLFAQDITHSTNFFKVDTANDRITLGSGNHATALVSIDGKTYTGAPIPNLSSTARNITLSGSTTDYNSHYFQGNALSAFGGAKSANVFIDGANSTAVAFVSNNALWVDSGNVVLNSANLGIGTFKPLNSLIVATGNVGIGTATPGTALDIQGTMRMLGTGAGSFVVQAAANQACTTTCTVGRALFGLDDGTLGVALPHLVSPTDATSDECLCGG